MDKTKPIVITGTGGITVPAGTASITVKSPLARLFPGGLRIVAGGAEKDDA
jgi:hypothetical protein